MRTFVVAKIHDVRVTQKSVEYHGSVGICAQLMERSGIQEYEQVHLINLSSGARWVTYAIPEVRGVFSLNGGGARLGELGDRFVILTYRQSESFDGAKVVFCDEHNAPRETFRYAST